jgi:phosphate transport system permease protein
MADASPFTAMATTEMPVAPSHAGSATVLQSHRGGHTTYVNKPLPADVATSTPEERRNTATLRPKDVARTIGSALAALSLTWLLFTQILAASGALGFIVVAFLLHVLFFGIVTSIDSPGPIVRDKVWAVIVHSAAVVLIFALGMILGYTISRGLNALPHVNFFTQDMSNASGSDPLTVGGISHAIVGTLIMISIALMVTIPLGVTCAVYLVEFPGKSARFVQTIVEAMTALPSIIAGLFIYATLIVTFHRPKSGFAAAMAISVMMLPIIIRASVVVLRLVPGTLKEASYALGSSHWKTVWTVVLPTAKSGLATAVILGTARGIGETSPVLITAGFTAAMNKNPFNGPMMSLPLYVFKAVGTGQPNMIIRAFGAATVLLLLVFILFIIARLIGGRGPGHQSKRAARKAAHLSAKDIERIEKAMAPALAVGSATTSQGATK